MRRLIPFVLLAAVAAVLALVLGITGERPPGGEEARTAGDAGARAASSADHATPPPDAAGADAAEETPVERRATTTTLPVRVTGPAGAAAAHAELFAEVDGEALRLRGDGGVVALPRPAVGATLLAWDGARFSGLLRVDAAEAGRRGDLLLATAEPGATILVAVTDADGRPLPDARARVAAAGPASAGAAGVVARALHAGEDAPLTADEGGRIAIAPLPADAYTVAVEAPGRVSKRRTLRVEAGGTARATVALPRAAAVRGTVSDGDGAPLAGARVALYQPPEVESPLFDPLDAFHQFGQLPGGIPAEHRAETGADGGFALDGVRPGTYALLAAGAGHRPRRSEETVTLAGGASHDFGRVTLHAGARLELTVRDAGGAPLEGAQVRWKTGGDAAFGFVPRERSAPQHTGDQGVAVLEALPFAEVELRVTHERMRPLDHRLTLRAEEPERALTLVMHPGAGITGTVTEAGSGQPLAGVRLRLQEAGDGQNALFGLDTRDATDAVSGEDGAFRFPHVAPGSYVVSAESDTHARALSESVTVGEDRAPPPVHLRLTRGARLRVEVLDAEDAPVEGAQVLAFGAAAGVQRQAVTDERGLVVFEHLAPCSYQVLQVPNGVSPLQAPAADLDMPMTFVTLEDGDDEIVTLGGGAAHATVSGFVTRDGAPVPSYAMTLIITGGGFKMSRADAQGHFEFEQVPPGEHVILASDPGAFAGRGGGSFYDTLVVPPGGGAVRRDVELPGGAIRVRVLAEESGKPLEGVPVFLRPADGTHLSGGDLGMTDAQGETTIRSLRPGRYVVAAGHAAAPMIPGEGTRAARILDGVEVGDGEERVVVRLGEGATFRARVSDAQGRYLQGAHLHYLDENGQPLSIVSMQGTNSKGVAQLEGLPPGPGRIVARHPEHGVREVQVHLRAGELTKQEITLAGGCRVRVTPVDADGRPIGGVLVTAVDERGTPVSTMWSMQETQDVRTAFFSGGPQTLGPLPPGAYVLQLIRPGQPVVREPLQVPPGTPELELRLEYAP